MIYFFTAALSFIITYLITPNVRYVALKLYVIDKINHRKIHKKVVTKLGGLAIFLGFFGGVLMLVLFDLNFLRFNFSAYFSLIICSTLMLLLGIYDDFQGSGARIKFIIQIIIAILAIKTGFILKSIHLGSLINIEFGIFSIPLTIIWIVGITNAVNLLDGLDGLASGVVTIVSSFLFLSGLVHKDPLMMSVSLAIIGANLAFLCYNFYPAKIFMGDTGSLFLGILMACLSLLPHKENEHINNPYFIPAFLTLLLPILDTTYAITRRILKKQHIFDGDFSHFHHYYIKRGFNQADTVKRFYFMTSALGLTSLFVTIISK